MHIDRKILIDYISKNLTDYSNPDIPSLLDLLGHYYLIYNPIEPKEMDSIFHNLDPVITSLSHRKERIIRRSIEQTTCIYTNAAFQRGLLVGAQLVLELSEGAPLRKEPV